VGYDPDAHAVLAGLLGALAERVGAGGRSHRDRSCGATTPDAAPVRTTAWRSSASSHGSAEPAADTVDPSADGPARRAPVSSSCTVRSGSWLRPIPSWSATCTAGCAGVVESVGGGRVEEFATLYEPQPCHVVVGVG
jgi:hypothetical protein